MKESDDILASRNLLPINLKDEFAQWLVNNGYKILAPKDFCEEIRAKSEKNTIVVYKKFSATVHLSVMDKDVKTVKRFLAERKCEK